MIQIIVFSLMKSLFPIFDRYSFEMRLLICSLFLASFLCAQEKSTRTMYINTKPYDQVIAEFKELDEKSDIAAMYSAGITDLGHPLDYMVLSRDKVFGPAQVKQKGKCIIMINNAIHPGEPDGVDASIELVRSFVATPTSLPQNVVLVIIPVYNIEGYLNRGSFSRANQNGPQECGFRGNALNLDLNRDFIKADSRNTIALEQIFQTWKPDIFIDNHVSDGADYQYTMTLIATQRNKLHPLLSEYMDKKLVPDIYRGMFALGSPICPYVETMGETPESGIVGFMETPRFATGYAALFNCIGFVPETHMLKPYNDRVWATYDLMVTIINQCSVDAEEIVRLHKQADEAVKTQVAFPLAWELDTTQYGMIEFKGYDASHVISKVSGLPVLYYDRKKPYTKQIRFYNTYVPTVSVSKPAMYVVPQAWSDVIYRLQINGVKMTRLIRDTVFDGNFYSITYVQHPKSPYESHYNHRGTQVSLSSQKFFAYAGDYVIITNQSCNRYIVETLEPQGDDSFFAWNFFDGILNQKEWFSDYVFDPIAEKLITEDPLLKAALDSAKKADTLLANNHWAQMNFIYQRSCYKETTHNRYPVARLEQPMKLPVDE